MPKGRLRTEPADVRLVVHAPIQPPAIDAPTVQDAKAFADKAHGVVAAAVERRQFADLREDASARSASAPKNGVSARSASAPKNGASARQA